jgi:cytochrome oxidase Cu insertion factor (SCO1/SenC/PrrC family)
VKTRVAVLALIAIGGAASCILADEPPKLPSLNEIISNLRGPEEKWAAYFETVVDRFSPSSDQVAELAKLLDNSALIWRDRNSDEIDRLKTSILLLMAKAREPNDKATLQLLEILTQTDNPRLYSAAALASSKHLSKATALRSGLVRALDAPWGDTKIDLHRYFPCCEGSRLTTAAREAARALLGCGVGDSEISDNLRRLVDEEGTSSSTVLKSDLIQSLKLNWEETSSPALTITKVRERRMALPGDIPVIHCGAKTAVSKMQGKPALLFFVFTRCHDLRKCSASASRVGLLQKELDRQGLGEAANIVVASYDPTYDSVERLEDFCRSRGANTLAMHFLQMDMSQTKALLSRFSALVSYNGDDIAAHSIELFLIDSNNRLAGVCSRGPWRNQQIVTAIRALTQEREENADVSAREEVKQHD